MIKWKLMIGTLPWVLAVVALKLVLERLCGFPGYVDFPEVGLVLTGGVFLLGFMLAGVMADYKEGEKLPGEVACALEAIEETLVHAGVTHPEVDPAAMRRGVLDATRSIEDWLHRKVGHDEIFRRLEALHDPIRTAERAGASHAAGRALGELHNLRRMVTRIAVISRTGFLASGYALLETLAVAIVIGLLISRFKTVVAEVVIVSSVTLIFVYMIKLIKDIDDPFEYSEDGQQGAAEVELFPLIEYRERLEGRVSAGAPGSEAKPAGAPAAAEVGAPR